MKPGIALKKIELVPTPHCNVGAACASVQVTYDNVVGKLVSPGRPSGFALLNAQGEDVCGIYKTTLHGNRVLLNKHGEGAVGNAGRELWPWAYAILQCHRQ